MSTERESRRDQLRRRVAFWAEKLKVEPKVVRVVRMTRKWGSCSSRGVVTLAADLADQPPGFQDFVIAHELLHLRVPTHGRVFKALMSMHVPDWREHDLVRRNGGRRGEAPQTRPVCGEDRVKRAP